MKTQKTLQLLLTLAMLVLLGACEKLDDGVGITGRGPVTEEKFHLEGFKNIEVDVNADVYLVQDVHHPVIISGQSNILNNLSVVSESETLKINYINNVGMHERLSIYISLPSLNQVSTTRSASIQTMKAFTTDCLIAQVYGSGTMSLEFEHAARIRSHVRGSGQISLSGTAETLEVVIYGSGRVLSSGLVSQQSIINITGTGKCEVHSGEELTVNINGNGKVFYTGNPGVLHSHLSGNGELRQL